MVWRNGTPCAHSEESEAETKRPPIKKIPGANLHQAKTDLHQVQILHVVGMDLHQMQIVFSLGRLHRRRNNSEISVFSTLYDYLLTIVYHIKVLIHVISKLTCTNYSHSSLAVFFDLCPFLPYFSSLK